MEGLTDFQFYLQFTKPLILNLPELNDRILAAAWIKKLMQLDDDENLRTQCLKSLLFVIQRKKLCEPFSLHPDVGPSLEEIERLKLPELAERIIQKRIRDCQKKLPPFTTDYSGDLLEYVASQEIPKFGVHVYYAFSNQPLPKWDRVEKAVLPKVAKNAVESPDEAIKLIETISKPQMRGEGDATEDDATEMEPTEPSDIDEDIELSPKTPEKLPKKVCFAGKSPLGDRPPTTPLGAIPEPDDRSPPTWGSNLIQVKEPPTKLLPSSDEVIETKSSSPPFSHAHHTPPLPIHSDLALPLFSPGLLNSHRNDAFIDEETPPDFDDEILEQSFSEHEIPTTTAKQQTQGKRIIKKTVSVTKPIEKKDPRKDARISAIFDKAAKVAGRKEPAPELEYELNEEIIEEPQIKSRITKKTFVRGVKKPSQFSAKGRSARTQPQPIPSQSQQSKTIVPKGRKIELRQRGTKEGRQGKIPKEPSREARPILAEAQAAQEDIQEIYSQYLPDFNVTPPPFSKAPEVRKRAERIKYRPEDFGLNEEVQWQHGPDYLAEVDEKVRSPYHSQRYEGFERAFPEIQRDDEAERFFALETLDEGYLSTPERSFEKLKNVYKRFDNLEMQSPALSDGVPATSPKPTSSPRRSETLRAKHLFDEEFPDYGIIEDYSPEQIIGDPYGLPELVQYQSYTPSPLKSGGSVKPLKKKSPDFRESFPTPPRDSDPYILEEIVATTPLNSDLQNIRQIEEIMAAAEAQYNALDDSPLRMDKSPEYQRFQYESPKYERAQYVLPKSPRPIYESKSEGLMDTLPPYEYLDTRNDVPSTDDLWETIEDEVLLEELSPPIQDILSVHEYTEGFFDKKRPKQTKRFVSGTLRKKLRRHSKKPKVQTVDEWEEELYEIPSPTRFSPRSPIPEYKTPPRRVKIKQTAPIDKRLEKLYDQIYSPKKAEILKRIASVLQDDTEELLVDYVSPPHIPTPPLRKLPAGSGRHLLLETPPKEMYENDEDIYYQQLCSPVSQSPLALSDLSPLELVESSPPIYPSPKYKSSVRTPPTPSPPPPPNVYREMLSGQKRVPYQMPYKTLIANRYLNRPPMGNICPRVPTVPELPETREEKLKYWRERVEGSKGKIERRPTLKRVLDKEIKRPLLKTVTEHINYPESPTSTRSPGDQRQLPYLRKDGSRPIRRKISRRRIDFDQPEEKAQSVIQQTIERIEKRVGPLPELSPEPREPLTFLDTDVEGDLTVPLQVDDYQLQGYETPPNLQRRKRSPKLQPLQMYNPRSDLYFEEPPTDFVDHLSPVTPINQPISYSKTTVTYDSPKTPELLDRGLYYEEQPLEGFESPTSPLTEPDMVPVDLYGPYEEIKRRPTYAVYDYTQGKRIPLQRHQRNISRNLDTVPEGDESPIQDPFGLPKLARSSPATRSYVYRTPSPRKRKPTRVSPKLSRLERIERMVSDIQIDDDASPETYYEEIQLLSPQLQPVSPKLPYASGEYHLDQVYDPYLDYPSPTAREPSYNIFMDDREQRDDSLIESPNYNILISPSPSPSPFSSPSPLSSPAESSRSPNEFYERVKQHEYTHHRYDPIGEHLTKRLQVGNKSIPLRSSARPRFKNIQEVTREEYPQSPVAEGRLIELESPTPYEKAVNEVLLAAENQYLELLDSTPTEQRIEMSGANDIYDTEIDPIMERYDQKMYDENLQRGLLDPSFEWQSPPREIIKLPELQPVTRYADEFNEYLDYTTVPNLYQSPTRQNEAYGLITDQDIFSDYEDVSSSILITSPEESPKQVRSRTPSPQERRVRSRSPIIRPTGLKPAIYPNLPPRSAERRDYGSPLPEAITFMDHEEKRMGKHQFASTPLSSRVRPDLSPSRPRQRIVRKRINFEQPKELTPERVSKSPKENIVKRVVETIVETVPENEVNTSIKAGRISSGRASPEFMIEDIPEEDELDFRWMDR